ncbi:hypothetical protein [Streptomyces sp. NPDC002402]
MSAAGVVLMLGGAGILLAASPAQAAEVAYKTECIPPPISGLPPVQGTTRVQITAPAEAKVGDEVEVVWKFVEAASKNPDILDLEKDTVKPTGTLKAAGAQTVNIAMEGPRSNPPIPKNSPMKLSDMKGKIKLTTAGEVTLTPDAYNINVSKPMSTDTKCTPKETVKAAATIKVTDGGGGTSGGTTSGGSTSGGGGGQTDFPGKEVTVAFACKSPGPASINSKVTINAKKNGGSYDLVVKTAKGVMNSPAALPAGALKPSMAVLLGGADKGTVPVTGPANPDPLEQGKPVDLPDMTGTYKPGATGKSTLSPGTLTIDVTLGGQKISIPCTVKGTAEASLELDTSAQPGGASGSSSNGSGSSGGGASSGGTSTSGGLAQTGSDNDGALRALALVAGTVILLGGAVFTFTPWRRLRGTR